MSCATVVVFMVLRQGTKQASEEQSILADVTASNSGRRFWSERLCILNEKKEKDKRKKAEKSYPSLLVSFSVRTCMYSSVGICVFFTLSLISVADSHFFLTSCEFT
jgi:hypothetical protein